MTSKSLSPFRDRAFIAVFIGFVVGLPLVVLAGMRSPEIASSALTLIGGAVAVLYKFYFDLRKARESERKIEQIEEKAAQEPEKTKFAWDLARAKLEAYFDRNLSQVRMIFFVAVVVMFVGFAFVLWGVEIAISKPMSTHTSYIAAISGIITQFIGATFMVIYRSTMAQANQFMEVLERINTVGMAVQILDSIPETEAQLKNSSRAEIVALLIAAEPRRANQNRPRKNGGAP